MPGTNAGTGWPLTFRCAKCKTYPIHWRPDGERDPKRGTNWAVTGAFKGKIADLDRASLARVSRIFKAEYECRDCKHRGFSGHSMVLSAFKLFQQFGAQKRR